MKQMGRNEWLQIATAPRNGTHIQAKIPGHGSDNVIAWQVDAYENDAGPCGGWAFVSEQEPPDSWTDGVCWAVNEDGAPSVQPTHWKPLPSGASATQRIRMTKRASPGVNRNIPNDPDPEAIQRALANEVVMKEAIQLLTEKRKSLRKTAEGEGVVLAELDDLYKRRDDEPDEILAMFRRKWSHFTAFFQDLGDQLDLFTARSVTRSDKAGYEHAGRMAGLTGKPCEAPDGLVGEGLQMWMEGWHTAHERRVNARSTLADDIAAAFKIVDEGGVVDGTGPVVKAATEKPAKGAKKGSAKAKAEAVRLVTAEDFAEENDPLTVAGVKYATMDGADEARARLAEIRAGNGFGPTEDEAAFA